MRGASFHLRPVLDPEACVAHNTRTWSEDHPPPGYLIGGDYGAVINAGDVVQVHAAKRAMASGKAKSMAEYSPVWEGVLNLDETRTAATLRDQVRTFADGYERLTGHRVLQAHVHLDEGRIENGRQKINAHAHIVVDRTDGRGRPIRLDRTRLQRVQDLAAEATGLVRGEDARTTRRRHLPHQAWRALAKQGLVQNQTQQAAQARSALEAPRREKVIRDQAWEEGHQAGVKSAEAALLPAIEALERRLDQEIKQARDAAAAAETRRAQLEADLEEARTQALVERFQRYPSGRLQKALGDVAAEERRMAAEASADPVCARDADFQTKQANLTRNGTALIKVLEARAAEPQRARTRKNRDRGWDR